MFAGVRLGKIGSEEAKLWQILLQIEVSPDFLCGASTRFAEIYPGSHVG